MPEIPAPTPECPRYEAVKADDGWWFVDVNEGWRESVVCTGMYEWAARWLVEQLQGKPFAPDTRPGEADRG